MNAMQRTCFATPAFAVLTTPGNTRHDQINAGRDWMRYSLAVTSLGLGTHPMSQALQEYPEVSFTKCLRRMGKPCKCLHALGMDQMPLQRHVGHWKREL